MMSKGQRKCPQGEQKSNLDIKEKFLCYVSVVGTKALLRDRIIHTSLHWVFVNITQDYRRHTQDLIGDYIKAFSYSFCCAYCLF